MVLKFNNITVTIFVSITILVVGILLKGGNGSPYVALGLVIKMELLKQTLKSCATAIYFFLFHAKRKLSDVIST